VELFIVGSVLGAEVAALMVVVVVIVLAVVFEGGVTRVVAGCVGWFWGMRVCLGWLGWGQVGSWLRGSWMLVSRCDKLMSSCEKSTSAAKLKK